MKIVYHKVSAETAFYGLIEYIFILFVILSFRTPFVAAIYNNYYLNEIIALFFVVLFISELSKVKIKYVLFNKWILIFLPYYAIMLLYIIMGGIGNGLKQFMAKFLIILPALSLTFTLYFSEHKIINLLKKYSNIMCVIAFISLYFWLFGSLFHLIQPTGNFYANWGGPHNYLSYYNLYFERQYATFMGINMVRNIGMFLEGPMYSSCLVIAIALELFLSDDLKYYGDYNKNYKYLHGFNRLFHPKSLILILTLLTTLTTTGYIMLILMIFLLILINNPRNRQIRLLKYAFTIVIAVVAFYLAHIIFLNKSTSMSWKTRSDDYAAGFRAWMHSPIWGNGFNNFDSVKYYMSSFRRDNLGFSNSLFVVLVEGGILLLSVYALPAITCIYNAIKQNKPGIAAFTTVIIIEFVAAIIQFEFLMILLLAFFYSFTIYSIGKKNIVRK